jgi:hypothetical protein
MGQVRYSLKDPEDNEHDEDASQTGGNGRRHIVRSELLLFFSCAHHFPLPLDSPVRSFSLTERKVKEYV